ncbi:hypothetical protein SAY87_015564 [Trapa incisa]|uniref:DUF7054 domain-containing protein n=1 Tax=Trapa incisa TaxID=236973 RepID=A0AAN7KZU4_9MYRT|nr:hypothetical protein SAY87_015564 [Trapa incisa]
MMLINKQKKNQNLKGNRLLITITVLGSAGPIRFVVNEEESVAAVICTALKSYARERRLPVLGTDMDDFLLYCPNYGSDAMSHWDTIGSVGARNFLLCKKPQSERTLGNGGSGEVGAARKFCGSWKSWINKSFNRKISSH